MMSFDLLHWFKIHFLPVALAAQPWRPCQVFNGQPAAWMFSVDVSVIFGMKKLRRAEVEDLPQPHADARVCQRRGVETE